MHTSCLCKKILETEFEKRKKLNTIYSIRAFARDLGIGKTTISDVLAGKRKLSRANSKKLFESLSITENETDYLAKNLFTDVLQ